mmetsp:Transcript_36692/g.83701  ORF Transcript_36692/g.83701 Transcript_36692/m.83701 type:complete len:121 (+) Transcript_36692:1144-1506(+)
MTQSSGFCLGRVTSPSPEDGCTASINWSWRFAMTPANSIMMHLRDATLLGRRLSTIGWLVFDAKLTTNNNKLVGCQRPTSHQLSETAARWYPGRFVSVCWPSDPGSPIYQGPTGGRRRPM